MQKSNKFYKNLKLMIISALLTAFGFIIPTFVPTIDIGVWSFTIGSHVPTIIAMFISPIAAIFTFLGTLIAFFLKTSNSFVWLRAASHLFFIILGILILKKNKDKLLNKKFATLLCIILGIVHAVFEILAVLFGMLIGLSVKQEGSALIYYLLIIVGAGTLLHSCIDFIISYTVYFALDKAKVLDK